MFEHVAVTGQSCGRACSETIIHAIILSKQSVQLEEYSPQNEYCLHCGLALRNHYS